MEQLLKERKRISDKLAETEPGTADYDCLMQSLAQVNTEIISLDEDERRLTGLNHQMEVEQDQLRLNEREAKSEARRGWVQIAVGALCSLAAAIISGKFAMAAIDRTVRIEEEEYKLPNKDAYSIVRTMIPRSK